MAILFADDPHSDSEVHHRKRSDSSQRLSKQTKNNWREPDYRIKTENETYPSGRLYSVWDNPGNSTKANISMKAEKGVYASRSLQNDWDSPEDAIEVKDGMKIGKAIHRVRIAYQSKILGRKKLLP